jgi:hypothetical protein
MAIQNPFKTTNPAKILQELVTKRDNFREAIKKDEASAPQLQAKVDAVYDGTNSAEYLDADAAVAANARKIAAGKRALDKTIEEIAELEAAEAAKADKAVRKKTHAEGLKEIEGFESEIAEWLDITARLEKRTAKLAVSILDFGGLHRYFSGGLPEVKLNAEFVAPVGRIFLKQC